MLNSSPHPPALRPATLADIPRIAIVAAAAFFHSPVFHFERPNYDLYPEDTVSDYASQYCQAILNPDVAVMVAEDIAECSEKDQAYDELRRLHPDFSQTKPPNKVVVGVVSLTLSESCKRRPLSCTQPPGTSTNHASLETFNYCRDKSTKAIQHYVQCTSDVKKHWLDRHMRVQTLAVHPAYWRRGHGTTLIQWCVDLADANDVQIGVSAVKMGIPAYEKAGFVQKQVVSIEAYGRHPAIELWIGIRSQKYPSHLHHFLQLYGRDSKWWGGASQTTTSGVEHVQVAAERLN